MFVSTGSTITFSSGFFAEITNISWSGIEREMFEGTHMGTPSGYRTFTPSNMVDPGELEVEMWFLAQTIMPATAVPEVVTVTLPSGGTGATSTWSASGFMTGFEWEAPVEEGMTATSTIKLTGPITVTP